MNPIITTNNTPTTTSILETPLPSATLDNLPGGYFNNNNNNKLNNDNIEDNSSTSSLPSTGVLLGAAAALVVAPVFGLAAIGLLALAPIEGDGLKNINQLNETLSHPIPITSTTTTNIPSNDNKSILKSEESNVIQGPDLSQSPIMKELGHSEGLENLLVGGTGATILEHEVPTTTIIHEPIYQEIKLPVNTVEPEVQSIRSEGVITPVVERENNHTLLKGAGAGLAAGIGGIALVDHFDKNKSISSTSNEVPTLRSTGSATPTITPSSQIERGISYSTSIETATTPTLHSIDSDTTIHQEPSYQPLPLSSPTEFFNPDSLNDRPNLQSRFSDSTFSPSLLSASSSEEQGLDTYDQQRYQNLGTSTGLGDEPRVSTKPLDASVDLHSNELSPSQTGFPIGVKGDEPTDAQQDFAHLSTPFVSEHQVQQPQIELLAPSTASTDQVEGDGTSFDDRSKWGKETYIALGAGGAGIVGAGLLVNQSLEHNNNEERPDRASQLSSPSPFQYNRLDTPQTDSPQTQSHSDLRTQEYPVHHNAAEYAQAHRSITPPPSNYQNQNQQQQQYQETDNHQLPHSPARYNLSDSSNNNNNNNRDRSDSNATQSPSNQNQYNNNYNNANNSPTPSQLLHQQLNSSTNNPNPVEHSPHLGISTRVDSISGRKKLHKDSLNRDNSLNNNTTGGRARSKSTSEGNNGRRFVSESGMNSVGNGNGYGGNGNGNQGSNDLWRNSMAQVVNDETDNRGGIRPPYVSIDTEDRRDTQPQHNRQIHYQPPLNNTINNNNNNNDNSVPSTPPQDTRKLTKNRRASVSNVEHRDRYYSSPENATNGGSPNGSGSGKKEGFLHKVFGRHSHTKSSSGSGN